ncbi:cellulose biosynthesis protein BcsC [Pusillimonas sp. ANT_WB101]|uniref:cellulose biosynthesis protein BcsC n=1 Tax=Pusillimonas sp. ANT_WB101 TaxID=2597356 RepID=UPI0011F05597|nr:cellulose biosynthesis protein BcsC [Pusillimonas sp. ANT_WB101]KAA0892608.1 tetratricopeptide repeat protein [Pusillimonas sp. ANT_WB101]
MSRYKQLALGLCVALLPTVGWAQDNTTKTLVDQGNYWQTRNDGARAAEAWNKLLLISPDNPQALYGLATLKLADKQLGDARGYLQKLKSANPQSLLVPLLEQDILLHTGKNMEALEQARLQATSGELDQAIAGYKKALGGQPPQGKIGWEYYTYLGYTNGGLPEAIAGLQRLAKQWPNDPQIALSLARHLARNEATRPEGIRRLAVLAERKDIGSEVTEIWRDALTWLGAPNADTRPLLEQYLVKHPDDQEIRLQLQQGAKSKVEPTRAAKTASVPRADPLRDRADRAMKLLDQGDTARAEAEFEAILAKRPNDNQALGGMGIVRMHQSNWADARTYLTKARRGNQAWQQALSSAEYWHDIEQADALRQAGKTQDAQKLLIQATKRQPTEVAANVMLADLQLDDGNTAQAKAAYQDILRRKPNSAGALEGLAKVARQSGDVESARRSLEDALGADPGNPWLRYQLAQLYQEKGRTQDARGLIDGLLLTNPNDPQALYVSAMMANERGDLATAYGTLNRIPTGQRTAPMQSFYTSVSRKLQIQQAVQLGRAGRKPEALATLVQIEQSADANDIETLGAVARAYAQMGELARGLAVLRPLRQQGGARSVDASLTYAGLLLSSNQDVEAAIVMRQLATQQMTTTQRKSLENLSDAYRIRQADALRQRGELPAAYDMLAPVLAKKPKNPDAIAALARMHAASGNGTKASALYEDLLRSDPDNAILHLGAAQVAQQLKNDRDAARQARIAVSLAPEQIDILSGAARVLRAQGKTSEAEELLKKAVALETSQSSAVAAVGAPNFALVAQPQTPEDIIAPLLPGPGSRLGTGLETGYIPSSETGPKTRSIAGSATGHIADPITGSATRPVTAQDQGMGQRYGSGSSSDQMLAAAPLSARTAANPFAPGASQDQQALSAEVARAAMSPLGRELDDIQQERSPEIRVGTEFHSRSGDAGTSKLEQAQLPVEIRFPVGNGKANVRVTPVALSSGSLSSNPYARGTFGGGPQAFLNDSSIPNTKNQKGVGLSVGYEMPGVTLDAGVTPLGFQEQSFTGGVLFDGTLDNAGTVSYRLDLSSRPVTDSVLSFAGMKDERTGQEWGGVSATGARLTLSKDFGDAGIYGSAAWHSLQGKNVASNQRTEINAGTYFRLVDEPNTKVTAGVNLNATFYNENLSHFTYGHGGYFSPRQYYGLGLPFTWAQRQGRLTWRVDGAVGVQKFSQADAPFFPNNANMQAGVQSALARLNRPELGGLSDGMYRGQSKTGVGYNLRASAEYRLASSWALGATAGADNASDYRQWSGGLYLRYYFHPQAGLMSLPVEPYRSPYGETFGR